MKHQKWEVHKQWHAHSTSSLYIYSVIWDGGRLPCYTVESFFFSFQNLFLSLNHMFPVITCPPSINMAVPPIVAHITTFTTQRPTFLLEISSRHPTCLPLNLVPPYAIIGGSSEHLQHQPSFAFMWLNRFWFILCIREIQQCLVKKWR